MYVYLCVGLITVFVICWPNHVTVCSSKLGYDPLSKRSAVLHGYD